MSSKKCRMELVFEDVQFRVEILNDQIIEN